MSREIIQIGEIKSEVKKRIEECEEIVNAFMEHLNFLLEDGEKICGNQKHILRSDALYCFEDDGNTSAEGYDYEAYWCFQLNPKVNVDMFRLLRDYAIQTECLWFVYSDTERKKDTFSDGSKRFFKLFISGVDLPRQHSYTKSIDCINSNSKNVSIFNVENVVTCALEIKELAKRRDLTEKLLEMVKSKS